MRRTSMVRFAAVLALAGLAACESPTSNLATAEPPTGGPAQYLAVAQMTVTNASGTPLVSWNSVSGATSYTVRLIRYNTLNGQYRNRSFLTLTTTTGTSYLDTNHVYTGNYTCTTGEEDPDGNVGGAWFEYEVVTNFPTGTSSARHYAPITDAYC